MLECLAGIRETSTSPTLIESDTHRFLRSLKQSTKLQRCYTQNFDGLEARAGLNIDLQKSDCEAVQLHGNLDFLRCTYCSQQVEWTSVDHTILLSGQLIQCPRCQSKLDERRLRGARTNIHVGYLRPNVVLFGDDDDPSSERKAEFIEQDGALQIDLLLIMGTSLAIHGVKSALKTTFIPAAHRSGGKVVYVNNVQPPRAFCKPVVDFVFEMDCDRWVQMLTRHDTTLQRSENAASPKKLSPPCLQLSPKAKNVAEAIQTAESTLISIGDYTDVQYRLKDQGEVRNDLSCFHAGGWLSTSPLMAILSLFDWGDTTKILHSSLMDFSPSDAPKRDQLLKGPIWPIGRKHTRVVVPHNPGNHWILVIVDIPHRVLYYYNSLTGYNLDECFRFVHRQMGRVGVLLGQDYADWNTPLDGVSSF